MFNYEFTPEALKTKLEKYKEIFGEDFSLGMLVELYNADSRRTLAKNSEYAEELKDILAAASDAIPESIGALAENVLSVTPEEDTSNALCVIAESLDGLAEAVSNMPFREVSGALDSMYVDVEDNSGEMAPSFTVKYLETERYHVIYAEKLGDISGFIVIGDKKEEKETSVNYGVTEIFYRTDNNGSCRLFFYEETPCKDPAIREIAEEVVRRLQNRRGT